MAGATKATRPAPKKRAPARKRSTSSSSTSSSSTPPAKASPPPPAAAGASGGGGGGGFSAPKWVDHGAGAILGVVVWAWVVLPFLKDGPDGVKRMLLAKFFNKGPDGKALG